MYMATRCSSSFVFCTAPKSFALMDVLITGSKPGKIADSIACYVRFAHEPIYLRVEAEIKVS